jgi:hypothetical protein
MTPEDFPGELGESFQQACAVFHLAPTADGYGLVLAQDQEGARWTQVTTDARGVDSMQSIWQTGLDCDYQPPGRSVLVTCPGWPVDCSLGLAGLDDPHDPPGTAGLEALRPPAPGTPARRRGMADIIARELVLSIPWRGCPAGVKIGGGCPPTSSLLGAVSPRISLIAGSRRQGPALLP